MIQNRLGNFHRRNTRNKHYRRPKNKQQNRRLPNRFRILRDGLRCKLLPLSISFKLTYLPQLADQNSWLTSNPHPYSIQPLQTFAALRTAVNDGSADFFMWEHFTSKKYYDNGEIKRIGEIYTPWPSWQIVASTSTTSRPTSSAALDSLFEALDKGIDYFNKNPEESVKYISTSLDYSEEDAREWLKTVKFAGKTRGVDGAVVEKTIGILKKAGVIGEEGMKGESMIGIKA